VAEPNAKLLNLSKEFGVRIMKSLRERSFLGAAVLTAASLALLGEGASRGNLARAEQQPTPPAAPQQGGPTTIRVPVNQVIVPVTVKDGEGRLVADLRRDEFRIFEDNVEQRIASFTAEPLPLSTVFLIDNDLKSKYAKPVSESLRAFVGGLSVNDETLICRFDQYFHEGKGFITDQDKLLTELKRTSLDTEPSVAPPSAAINNGPEINGHSSLGDAPSTTGATMNLKNRPTKALDDAVYQAAQLLKDRDPERRRRKIIFLISDGVNAPKFNKYNYDTTIRELLRYDIAVYGVGVGSAVFDGRFERLAKYARDTGGDVYYAVRSRAMEELYSRVTEEARNQYVLAYAPTGTDRSLEYHSIEVRVRREGLKILTREGYYVGAMAR
jgi:Ca-activated chloride channel homolog